MIAIEQLSSQDSFLLYLIGKRTNEQKNNPHYVGYFLNDANCFFRFGILIKYMPKNRKVKKERPVTYVSFGAGD